MFSLLCLRLAQLHRKGFLLCWTHSFPFQAFCVLRAVGPLLELRAPPLALLSVLSVAMVLLRFLCGATCMGCISQTRRLVMKLELHAACWDVFLCMWSTAVGSAGRGEWYCRMFLQVTEIKLCIFRESPPKQRIYLLLTATASEWCCDLYFELDSPGVKSWISSCICWRRGSL